MSSTKEQDDLVPFDSIPLDEEVQVETKTSKLNVFMWSMYDLANTIYSMVIVSLIINRYVLVIGQVENGLEYGQVSLIYGIVTSAMQIFVAICVPVVGALSDNAGKRKPFIISLTGIIVLFASLIGFWHNLTTVLIFYVIANIAYQFSLTFYDAMLPFIARKEDIGKVAGFGVAWGYLGTIIALVIFLPLMLKWGDVVSQIPQDGTLADLSYGYTDYPISFILPMGLFLVLGLPIIWVRERQKPGKMPPARKLIRNSFRQVWETFKDIRTHRQLFYFIIGYFFLADVANVVVAYMMPIVTDGLIIGQNGDPSDIFGTIFIIIATVSAVAFTYFVGKFGEKNGAKKTFFLVGGLWIISLAIGIISIFAFAPIDIGFNFPFIFVLLMGIIAGPALGGTWTAQRIMITELAPKEKFGEYFGFSKLSGKVSSALGPIIVGVMLNALHSTLGNVAYAWAMIAIGIILVVGLVIIAFVRPEEGAKNY